MSSARGHVPVLVHEVLAGLQVRPGGRYVDATLGAGGHAANILHASAPDGLLLGLDTDAEAIAFAQEVLRPFGERVLLRAENFRKLEMLVAALGFEPADGVLMDLGLSSRQLDDASRGFSFTHDGPLDMRMDPSQSNTAAYFVNQLAEAELADIIWRYGEERDSRRIARAIVRARPITSTTRLAEIVAGTRGRRGRIHPATRTFQALRIAVNDELVSLSEALPQACHVLRGGGRLAVISFHSLEDRIVKRFLQQEARDCICPPEAPSCTCQHSATVRIVTRKAIRPGDKEIAANPRSRSARLRIAERLPLQNRI